MLHCFLSQIFSSESPQYEEKQSVDASLEEPDPNASLEEPDPNDKSYVPTQDSIHVYQSSMRENLR